MPYAFGHLFGAWAAGKVFERSFHRRISRTGWGLLLLGGILPDIDHIIDWTTGLEIHRTITHSIFFAIICWIIVYVVLKIWNSSSVKSSIDPLTAYAIFAGILIHITLDILTSGYGTNILYPFPVWLSLSGFSISRSAVPFLSGMPYDSLLVSMKAAILDMGIGVSWISYLFLTRRIRF